MKTRRDEVFEDALVELGSLSGKVTQLLSGLANASSDGPQLEHLKQKFLENERLLIQRIAQIDSALRDLHRLVVRGPHPPQDSKK